MMRFSAPCGAGAQVDTRASVSAVRMRYVEKGRGRAAGHPTPRAQIRTCGTTAYGSYLGCMASKLDAHDAVGSTRVPGSDAGPRSTVPCSPWSTRFPPQPPPRVAPAGACLRCSAASSVSGRRRRARSPSRWPPSAAQTARAVFPHAAFTKTPSQALRSKESIPPGSPAPTRYKVLTLAAASSRRSASACIDATKSAARSNGRVG